jgi:mannose-6-phosphate isomerase-like protein (cupin superfamily)
MTLPNQPVWASDRREAIERPQGAKVKQILPGVEMCALVGAHNGARGLFTGLLTLAPKAAYVVYTRRYAEVLVLITGEAAVDVENRRYRPGSMDAISIPAGLARQVVNLSGTQPALLHVAMSSPVPEQTWVNSRFTPVPQPAGITGHAGAERICFNRPSDRFELAPRALFQDLYNIDLGTRGICGGYGVFEPGARLPCHRHEFDESITIIKGKATCVVEGERYELADNATALVPQGRCHYFINLTLDPMAMLWVYAGDRPDRIVMEETYCHPQKLA